VNEATISTDQPNPKPKAGNRRPLRRVSKIAVWVLGVPAALLILLYVVLLITPVRLPFTGQAVRGFVQGFIPPTSSIEMGDMALALESGIWPVIQFSPVVLTDSKSGARVAMAALEVGFSPARALLGQPGATVTVVEPHIQMVQDLYGPRLSTFEMVDSPDGGTPTLRVLEGEDAFPTIAISPEGIGSAPGKPVPTRAHAIG